MRPVVWSSKLRIEDLGEFKMTALLNALVILALTLMLGVSNGSFTFFQNLFGGG